MVASKKQYLPNQGGIFQQVNTMDRQKDSIDQHTDQEILGVLLREVAKAGNELRSAEADCAKANKRLRFAVLLANRLKGRIDGFTSSSS